MNSQLSVVKRIVEVMNPETAEWTVIDFTQLRKYDLFRMFEPNGEPVLGESGQPNFIADSDYYIGKDGVEKVNTVV
jgi:hypothetical protein